MLACAGAWAADYHPMDVKTGQWETTMIEHMTGVPPIPPEALSHLSPEQRARLQAAMEARSGKPIVSKSCLTKKDLTTGWDIGRQGAKQRCTPSLVTSTSSKQELHMKCDGEINANDTIIIERVDSEHVRGTARITETGDSNAGRPMNINVDLTGKWIGPVCTDK
jgi:hypothetical protein